MSTATTPTIEIVPMQGLNMRQGKLSILVAKVSGLAAGATNVISLGGTAAGNFSVLRTRTFPASIAGTFWVIGILQGTVAINYGDDQQDIVVQELPIDTDPELTVTVTSGGTPSNPTPMPVLVIGD